MSTDEVRDTQNIMEFQNGAFQVREYYNKLVV